MDRVKPPNVSKENFEKMRCIIKENKIRSLLGNYFEIRHIKSQPQLNGKVCQVVDVNLEKSDMFDSRVVCKLEGQDKRLSLKSTNLVGVGANIDQFSDLTCMEGNPLRKSESYLADVTVKKMLQQVLFWAQETNQNRRDEIYR